LLGLHSHHYLHLPYQNSKLHITPSMANLVAKYAMKKALGNEMEKYKGKSAAGPYVSIFLS